MTHWRRFGGGEPPRKEKIRMNGIIRTVLGDINSSEPGICQCHEHLFVEMDKSYEVSKALYMDDLAKSAGELQEYRAAGGSLSASIDQIGYGLGLRQIDGLREDWGRALIAARPPAGVAGRPAPTTAALRRKEKRNCASNGRIQLRGRVGRGCFVSSINPLHPSRKKGMERVKLLACDKVV